MPGKVYLFHGEDTYAVAEARQKLEKELLDPNWREFNLTVLPGDVSGKKIVEALLTVPFGMGNRLVVIKDPSFLSGKGEDPSMGDFENLLEKGLPDTSFLLLTAAKADSRLKLVKKLVSAGIVREFGAPKPWQIEEQLSGWVSEEVTKRQRRIAPDGVSALLAATGGDRWRITREIEKLTSYAAEGERITAELVRTLVAGSDVEVFALTDALARKSAGDALVALNRLMTTEHALKVLAAAVTILRGWLRLKQLQAQGMSAQGIAQAIGARSDFKVKKDLEAIRAWKPEELSRALTILLDLDVGIKSGEWPTEHHRVLWEKAIAQMLASPRS